MQYSKFWNKYRTVGNKEIYGVPERKCAAKFCEGPAVGRENGLDEADEAV